MLEQEMRGSWILHAFGKSAKDILRPRELQLQREAGLQDAAPWVKVMGESRFRIR